MKLKKLAIVTTHPIQYNAPLFQLLAQQKGICLKVFYTWGQSKEKVYDPGFGQAVSWDIPLLDGYDSEFIPNIASKPGTHHFFGIVNPNVIRIIKDFSPDLLMVYGWSFYSHLKILYSFKGKLPVFFRGDSHLLNEPDYFSFRKHVRRLILSMVYKHIDKALYVGQANRAYYLKHGLKANQLIFAPHAVDNNRFELNGSAFVQKATEWQKALGISDDCIVFMFVGKLEALKNIDVLINMFKSLPERDARLVIVGTGPDEQKLREIALEDQRILFLGFQNQDKMPIVYRISDILILPSKSETWGLCINEAFACARPAIVSDKVGCGPDLIVPGQTGWIFNNGDKQTLLKSMQQALQLGKNGLYRMGLEAAQKIKMWSYDKVVEKIMQELS